MRRFAAVVLTLVVAGCASGRTAPPEPSHTSGTAAPVPTPVPATAPLRVVATSPMVVRDTPTPPAFAPPAGVQDIVFANAADGWLVTSLQVGSQGWTSAIWRTTDGGESWQEVWRNPGGGLSRIGRFPAGGGLYAAGYRGTPGAPGGTALWVTSADGGATWQPSTPKLPPPPPPGPGGLDLPLWPSLQFDPVTPLIGYAAIDPVNLYQQQTQILATTDGGRTWRALPLPTGFFPTGGIDFQDAHNGWITGGAKGICSQIWRTSDGGQSWQPVPGACTDIGLYAIDFPDARHGFASGGTLPFLGAQAGILKTDDGGAHWQTVYHTHGPGSGGPITHLVFTSPTQGWAWGSTCKLGQNGPCRGAVLITDNGGDSWTETGPAAVTLAAVGRSAWADEGWPEANGLAHTADGGRTWTSSVQPPAADFGTVSTAPGSSTVWLTTGGGTFASEDGGLTWVRTWARSLPVVRAGGGVVFSPVSPELEVSRNDGGTWSPLRLPGEDAVVADVAFATEQDGWALLPIRGCTVGCTTVDRTQDGGLTWTQVGQSDLEGEGAHVAFTPSMGVIVSTVAVPPPSGKGPTGFPPALGISRDDGEHWTTVPLPSQASCASPAAVGTDVWVPCQNTPYGGLILRSTDSGRTWTEYTSDDVVPESVAMLDAAHGWMIAADGGATRDALYRTNDGGATWTEVWPAL